ncbi:uroporphyrinogen-III C-methyltransferase [Aliikangiella coralliicola]|uniref:uroporphyrinogen-III C-methyltransferase n=1 Tax=Aliikangiella coralliicola TaxID=2592383 RepID=A0A545U5Y9_9GAMM|nr:uroporphyrinogen-III C-methyltransferase [Aliikangiella coralliicola]TQV84881.1 uroporphyrinogen-III C-methyltransferase [Aliikangiella coralliicola]
MTIKKNLTGYHKLDSQVDHITQTGSKKTGKVYLVGAGPGAMDLLTVKALRIIQSSDVILYDKLVSDEIKSSFPKGCKKIFVGKSKDNHSIAQESLNQLLVRLCHKGLQVCRLKGGDPFVFGRGSEEMLAISEVGLDVEIVPGITAASGCTSYAGIPLTHREVSQGCTFITGHAKNELKLNWASLATLDHTLVFYMSLTRLSFISHQLIKHGLNANTPAALIENGSQPQQRVITSSLIELSTQADLKQFKSPTLVVIGDVVRYQQQLDWFQKAQFDDKKSIRLSA